MRAECADAPADAVPELEADENKSCWFDSAAVVDPRFSGRAFL